jgi:hypothetical protein
MKVQVVVSLSLLAILSAAFFFRNTSTRRPVPHHVAQAYSRWVQEHGKLYATPSERDYRLFVFYDQWLFVEKSNKDYEQAAAAAGQTLTGPMFEINGFSDLTTEEFEVKYTGALVDPEEELHEITESMLAVPSSSLSATSLGAEYNVIIRNQGGCGSCWAFSGVAGLEKFYFDKEHVRLEFSQQELVDCTCNGCRGGFVAGGLDYAAQYGLSPLSKYPYSGTQGVCNPNKPNNVMIGNKVFATNYSQKLAVAVSAKGVHSSAAIFASGKFRFASKTSDILDAQLTGDCPEKANHAINLQWAVGDTARVFNSWGTGWGEGGFKTIKVCSENNLIGGVTARLIHPYGEI